MLLANGFYALRPMVDDTTIIRSSETAGAEIAVQCALTPSADRIGSFGEEINGKAMDGLFCWTIPSVLAWMEDKDLGIAPPADWTEWMTDIYPTLSQAKLIVNAAAKPVTSRSDVVTPEQPSITLRLKEAIEYMGISRNRFNSEVRPNVNEFRIGDRGVGFHSNELDQWVSGQRFEPTPSSHQSARKEKKAANGLIQRGHTWHIDKIVGGQRICRSTGTRDFETAERFLAKLIGEEYEARSFGKRPERLFDEAAEYYLEHNRHKKSIGDDRQHLARLRSFEDLARTPIDKLHRGTLDNFVTSRRREGVSTATINHALKVVRQLLNQAANDWRDEHGLTWLKIAPKIKLLVETDKRAPRVLTWPEQQNFFSLLPAHLRDMATFAVNTGCRESEICSLSWEWEKEVMDTSVFVLPRAMTKSNRARVVVPNRVARACIDAQRGIHPERVFTYRGKPVEKINNTGWKAARKAAGLYDPKTGLRVHDLRHTAATRLRHAGADEETRREILGHASGRSMTNHYSAASLRHLINSVELLCPTADGNLLFDDIVLRV